VKRSIELWLREAVRGFGGRLVNSMPRVGPNGSASISLAPFASLELAVNYEKKIIYFHDKATWPNVLHEIAHVFASRQAPDESEEFSFLYWEWALAQTVPNGVEEWVEANREYALYTGDEIGMVSREVLLSELSKAKTKGETIGNIVGGQPVSVRYGHGRGQVFPSFSAALS